VLIDGVRWWRCSNAFWGCNWLVAEETGSGECFSCRLTRRRPDPTDTPAMEKLAAVELDKRRLIIQLYQLGLPIEPYYQREGGLAFDLLSSFSGERVMIGHANGVITLDVAESLDAYREAIRVRLAEPYRTMLGHLRHEVGHYYQWVLVPEGTLADRCRAVFGDERASYSDAIDRHYRLGAPADWADAFISEYATMHPWEDFAETFAHYLHISGTLRTAAAVDLAILDDPYEDGTATGTREAQLIRPLPDYTEAGFDRMLEDWHWTSMLFNRINRSMGQRDLYPFTLSAPVLRKLAFMHGLITDGTASD